MAERQPRPDRRSDAGRGLDLAMYGTGLRLARPPSAGREGWRKLHIAVDPETGRVPGRGADPLGRARHHAGPAAMLGRIGGRLGRVYGDSAYAGGPAHRAVAGRRQALPNAEGIFRPKAPDVRAAWERATTGYGRRNAAGWTSSRRKRTLD